MQKIISSDCGKAFTVDETRVIFVVPFLVARALREITGAVLSGAESPS